MTQCEMLAEHLRSGRSITPLESLNLYGIMATSQRVGELKKPPFNLPIETEMISVVGESGKAKRVAKYSMKAVLESGDMAK